MTELRNGKYVHEQCLMLDISQEQNQIFSQRDALAEEIDILTDETNSLYPNTSFWTSIFGNEEEENRVSEAKEKLQAQIAYKRKQIEKLTLQDDKLMLRNNQYLVSNATEINDCIKYWPSYPPDYFWYNLKQQALQKCNFKCKSCRKKANQTLDLHHLRPLALGGLNELENLIILCRTCHQARHSHQFTGQDAAQKTSRIKNKLTNLDKVKLALSSNKRLWIRYTDDKGTQTERWIKVYRINKKWVESRCELRNDDRSFRIDRIDFAKVYGMKDT